MRNTAGVGMKMWRVLLSVGALAGTLCSPIAYSQSTNQGGIRGEATDSSGAVVPGAKVTITDTGTNISQSTTTNSGGSYAFTALKPSSYRMLLEASGFGPVEKAGIILTVNQQTTINFSLTPSSQQTTVTVQAVPVLLDSDNATLGADIGSQYLTQVPLENRDPLRHRIPSRRRHGDSRIRYQ